jgi:hypothetical protein
MQELDILLLVSARRLLRAHIRKPRSCPTPGQKEAAGGGSLGIHSLSWPGREGSGWGGPTSRTRRRKPVPKRAPARLVRACVCLQQPCSAQPYLGCGFPLHVFVLRRHLVDHRGREKHGSPDLWSCVRAMKTRHVGCKAPSSRLLPKLGHCPWVTNGERRQQPQEVADYEPQWLFGGTTGSL